MHTAPRNLVIKGGSIEIPQDLWPALRSDHAGETGAVCIYRGILAVTRDPSIAAFAREHQATEEEHLRVMELLLPRQRRSQLLPVWRLAGWLTGALPALFGAPAVYRTIDAVESFVDLHYREQIDQLSGQENYQELRRILQQCRDDELTHRDEARGRLGAPGLIGRLWTSMVGGGSRVGVIIASRL